MHNGGVAPDGGDISSTDLICDSANVLNASLWGVNILKSGVGNGTFA
ncbi:hypothetical protein SDC9_209548 [bioreactor metagenome]|uniref:Uncharacterized protein n=1 Tax=bioreactor metagenome TaxID=1076179 RepID=A0A645JN97_9ZZZZ